MISQTKNVDSIKSQISALRRQENISNLNLLALPSLLESLHDFYIDGTCVLLIETPAILHEERRYFRVHFIASCLDALLKALESMDTGEHFLLEFAISIKTTMQLGALDFALNLANSRLKYLASYARLIKIFDKSDLAKTHSTKTANFDLTKTHSTTSKAKPQTPQLSPTHHESAPLSLKPVIATAFNPLFDRFLDDGELASREAILIKTEEIASFIIYEIRGGFAHIDFVYNTFGRAGLIALWQGFYKAISKKKLKGVMLWVNVANAKALNMYKIEDFTPSYELNFIYEYSRLNKN